MALVVAFIAPFFTDSKTAASLRSQAKSDNYAGSVQLVTKNVIKPVTITSEILSLPNPNHSMDPTLVKLASRYKQVRFQRNWLDNVEKGRQPANVGVASDWTLETLWHRVGDRFEAVPLIGSDARAISSVYVELNQGKNDFVVVYKSRRGEERKVNFRVDQSTISKSY